LPINYRLATRAADGSYAFVYEKQVGDKVAGWRQHRFVQRGETRIGALAGREGKTMP